MNLPIDIDATSGIPVYIQLGEQIKILIRHGELKVGDLMPTTRSLAVQLGINVNTVARVYRELQAEGQLRLQRGVGTFMAENAQKPMPKREFKELEIKIAEIIKIAKRAGFSPKELAQFITTRWKEDNHV